MLNIGFFEIMLIIGIVLILLELIGVELSSVIGIETLSVSLFFLIFGVKGIVSGGIFSSGVVALVVTAIVHFAVVVPVKRSQNTTAVSRQSFIGTRAKVSVAIPATGVGEIVISTGITKVAQIARSHDGVAIPEDAEVLIVSIENRVSHVTRIDDETSPVEPDSSNTVT